MIKVYVAGPYSKGNRLRNALRNIEVAQELLCLGYAPFVPLLSHWWDEYIPNCYKTWLAYDRVWCLTCDAILRTPGESDGADSEVKLMETHGRVVVHSVEELLRRLPPERKQDE